MNNNILPFSKNNIEIPNNGVQLSGKVSTERIFEELNKDFEEFKLWTTRRRRIALIIFIILENWDKEKVLSNLKYFDDTKIFIENKNSKFSVPQNFSFFLHSIELSISQIEDYIRRKYSHIELEYPKGKETI
jgi:hypothetical protein